MISDQLSKSTSRFTRNMLAIMRNASIIETIIGVAPRAQRDGSIIHSGGTSTYSMVGTDIFHVY